MKKYLDSKKIKFSALGGILALGEYIKAKHISHVSVIDKQFYREYTQISRCRRNKKSNFISSAFIDRVVSILYIFDFCF